MPICIHILHTCALNSSQLHRILASLCSTFVFLFYSENIELISFAQ
jgi:hypothetical protein